MQASSPSPTSQEMNVTGETVQEHKPLVNPQQSIRPSGSATANVSILNNLSQRPQMVNSASISGASSIGLQTMGGTSMAVHMSNMISSGMTSSGMAGITPVSGSAGLMASAQLAQNTALGSVASASSNMSANTNIGISSSMSTLQGNIGMGQTVSGLGQGNMPSGAQLGQAGISMNQNMMNNLGPASLSSGSGTMMPTPGISQQGVNSLGLNNNSSINMPMVPNAPGVQQTQSRYVRIWEVMYVFHVSVFKLQ